MTYQSENKARKQGKKTRQENKARKKNDKLPMFDQTYNEKEK